MSADPELRDVLAGIDGPRRPRPEFEARLRAEVTGVETAPFPAAGPPVRRAGPDRRGVWAVAAAAVAVALLVAVFMQVEGDDRLNVVDEPTTTEAPSSLGEACATFRNTAFGGLDRNEVLGPANAGSLDTAEDVRRAAITLRDASNRFLAAAAALGRRDIASSAEAQRLLTQLDFAARAGAEPDQLNSALASLRQAGDQLAALDLKLTAAGVTECL